MSSNNKHIVILTPGFPADEADINCIPALQLYVQSLLEQQNVTVSVVTLQYPNIKAPYSWNDCEVTPCYQGRSKWRSPFKWRKAVVTIDKLNKRNPIDLIHCFWYTESVLVGKKCKRKFGIPLLITLMGQDSKKKNKYLKLIKVKNPYVVALSKFQAEEYKTSTGQSCQEIIPWGIQKNDISVSQNDKSEVILGVGSLTGIKNYPLFIDVIAQIKRNSPDIEVRILGGGYLEKQLKELVVNTGLDKNIKIFGEVSRNEVINHMRECKVLLHTSKSESFGYVFIEALANGMRIVSTPVGIAEKTSYWGVGESVKDLAQEVLNKLASKDKYQPKIPLMADTVEKYASIYEHLVSNPSNS